MSDSELDFFSEKFNPERALYEIRTLPPTLPNIKPLDYLGKCRILLPRDDPNFFDPNQQKVKKEEKIAQMSAEERKIKGKHHSICNS